MNLLMISGDRSVLSGKQSAFLATLTELIRHFDRIDILCPRVDDAIEPAIDRVFFHSCPSGLFFQPWWIARKGRQLHAVHGYDVMTVHEYPPFYNGIGAGMLWRRTSIPYAIEIHHIVGYPKAASMTEWAGKWLSWLYLRRDAVSAAAVRTVNEEVKDVLAKWGIAEQKIHVVPSFYLDALLLKPEPASEKSYDVAFCARLVANKGLLTAIKAASSIDGATLLVIGDGPERYPAMRLVRELGMESRVTFAGWLPKPQDVVQAIRSAKVFLMNSKSEGGPRVALEAMACGMPVLATKVGVMTDVIADGVNGMFTTGDCVDVAEKLRVLLGDDPLRQRLGKEAEKIIGRFEKKVLIQRYAEFLKGIARK